mmetsp:Transcript_111/g.149  ORF Transcript_111/g.149 Transcript_111/m.149 type:complete len:135 (+) Transcript_111:134-538(+)
MSIRPNDLPPVQDMPPPGGFRKVDIIRQFPVRGPKGYQIWLGAVAVVAYGFYTVGKTNNQRAEQKLEDRRIRYTMSPLLQAEADLEYMQREKELIKKEAEIMQTVPGWIPGASVYNSKRFVPRALDPMNKSASN